VFICDGRETQRLRGQNIYVGEGRLESADEIETHYIPAKPGQKIYVASDGLFEQVGGPLGEPYAYKQFTEIILTNHNEPLAVISEKIWEAFETYRNREARVDDFELVSFTV
jgi:serine phosphatase RsbU (regulator of sigma subunit)